MTYRRITIGCGQLTALLLGAVLMLTAANGCDNLRPSDRAAGPAESERPAPAGAAATSRPAAHAAGDCGQKMAWAKMSSSVRTLWETLGWDQRSWKGDAPPPASEGTAWRDLSLEQRSAAVKLGCEPTNWNATHSRDDRPSWTKT
jgi:hypothetical protein